MRTYVFVFDQNISMTEMTLFGDQVGREDSPLLLKNFSPATYQF